MYRVCAFGGDSEALAFMPVLGPCAFVGEGVVVGIAVCFGEDKDIGGRARLVEVNFANCGSRWLCTLWKRYRTFARYSCLGMVRWWIGWVGRGASLPLP